MAIIHLVAHLSDLSGSQLVLLDVIRAINHPPHDILVICPSKGPFSERLDALGVKWLEVRHPLVALREQPGLLSRWGLIQERLNYVAALRRQFKQRRPDLVLINTTMNPYAGLAARAAGRHAVYFVHEVLPPTAMNRFKCKIVQWSSDLILAPAKANGAMFPSAIRTGKFIQLPLGIDLQRFETTPEKRQAARHQLEIRPNEKVIGTVCHITRNKGVHVVLQAVRTLAAQAPEIRLLIAGSPDPHARDYFEELNAYVDEHDMRGIVKFLPHVDRIEDIYAGLDVFVLASEMESSPRVILESMSASVPVVATAVGGVPELIDNDRGWLVTPNSPELLARTIEEVLGEASNNQKTMTALKYVRERHNLGSFEENVRKHLAMYLR